MTTTFDALQRILQKYEKKLTFIDYKILSNAIDTIHTLQHSENSHRLDTMIEQGMGAFTKDFETYRQGRDPNKKNR